MPANDVFFDVFEDSGGSSVFGDVFQWTAVTVITGCIAALQVYVSGPVVCDVYQGGMVAGQAGCCE